MKLVVVCHLENDIANKSGFAKNLPQERQTFQHVPMLLEWFSEIDIPITIAVMVGGQTGGKLLQNRALQNQSQRDNFEFGIHYHAEKFVDGRWTYEEPLSENEYLSYFSEFKKVFNITPSSIVFGKWKIDKKSFPLLKNLGITHDGSKILENGIIEKPKNEDGLISVPSISYQGRPVNPLTRFSDFLIMKRILTRQGNDNILVHFAFHSYDFFSFSSGAPKWRSIKKKIFLKLISLARQQKSEMLHLKDCRPEYYKNLQNIHLPVLARASQALGH